MGWSTDGEAERRRQACDALEGEFRAIHGAAALGDKFPAMGSAEREAALRESCHSGDGQSALCLSGGGIRSATFCLGVLQGLAAARVLGTFHYLSTVSGGGYIGNWLTAWQRRADSPQAAIDALAASAGPPRGAPDAASAQRTGIEPEPIRRLRAYSNYLSPAVDLGGDLFALVGTFVRNLFLHWLAIVPLLVAILLVPRLYVAFLWRSGELTPLKFGRIGHDAPWIERLLAWLPDVRWIHDVVESLLRGLVTAIDAGLGWLEGCLEIFVVFMNGGLRGPTSVLVIAAVLVCFALAYIVADLPDEETNAVQRKDRFGRFCLLPLATATLLFSWLGAWAALPPPPKVAWTDHWLWERLAASSASLSWGGVGGVVVYWIGVIAGYIWRRKRQPGSALTGRHAFVCFLAATVIGLVGGAALGWALSTAHGFGAGPMLVRPAVPSWLGWYAVLSAPAILGVLWIGVTVYAGIVSKRRTESDREWWARAGGYWLIAALAWAALGIVVLHLPRWVLSIPALQAVPGSATFGATALLGLISSAWGYWGKYRVAVKDQTISVAGRLGTRVLDLLALAFVLLLCVLISLGVSASLQRAGQVGRDVTAAVGSELTDYLNERACAAGCSTCVAKDCTKPPTQLPVARKLSAAYEVVLHYSPLLGLTVAFVALLLLGTGMWRFIGGNTFSLHSMYCNRLVRAYVGASTPSAARRPHWFTGFDPADNLPLAVGQGAAGLRLFPVINATLNLVKPAGDRLEWQQRKAAPFTLTPLYCGSPRLGYRRTADYEPFGSNAQATAVTLGRAMAVSGAAASPNMGYHSSMLVALVMFFFNVRLGWWMRNPAFADSAPAEAMGSLRLLAAEALGRTSETEPCVYLSDGGHFENLGLYEMIRRRCRRIVVVDAAHDPDYAYEDLASCIRKIRIDFGIPVDFDEGLPTPASCRRTRLPFALGRIGYRAVDGPSARDGTIVYLKPALCGDEPTDLLDYVIRSRRGAVVFPQQPTADQFFDEAQFESYRVLGLLAAEKAFGKCGKPAEDPWPTIGPPHGPPGGAGGAGPIGPVAAVPSPAAAMGAGAAGGAVAEGSSPFRSLSDAGKLALVAAGTAAIAITGTVTLTNSELRLSRESLQALSSVTGTVQLSDQDRRALMERIGALEKSIGDLTARIAVPGAPSPGSQDLRSAVDALTRGIATAG